MPKKDQKKSTREDVYTLHIDVEPDHTHHAATRASDVRMQEKETATHEKEIHIPKKESNEPKSPSLFSKIWDKFEFVFVSAAVFGVIYAVLNWQALYQNAIHYYEVATGFESPLNELTEEAPEVAERLNTVAIAQGTSQNSIPDLRLEVFPPDMRIVIPRINQNVPVVGVKNENLIARRWEELEKDIQGALRNGVVHYPGTALPGEDGNVVVTGHSSYYAWDAGRFKDVFALLHDVREDDKVVVYFNQKKYIYQITEKKVVLPKDIDVLKPTNQEQITLITCTPIGTNLKRLILVGKLVESN